MHSSQQSADQPKGLQNKVLSEGKTVWEVLNMKPPSILSPPLRVGARS